MRTKSRGGRAEKRGPANPFTTQTTAPVDEYQIVKRKGSWGRRAVTTAVVLVAVVLMVAGVKSITRGDPVIPTPPAPPDITGMQQAAASFTADYLTYQPLDGGANTAAIAGHLTEPDNAGRLTWRGAGWMAPDQVIPGQVVTDPADPTRHVVSVQARVQVATPAGSSTPSPDPRTQPPGVAGNYSTRPNGYVDAGSVWLDLAVPTVTDTAGVTRIDAAGPVFATTPAVVHLVGDPPRGGQEGPNSGWAATVFDAYTGTNQTNLDYFTDPAHHLTPLGGAFTRTGNPTVTARAPVNDTQAAQISVDWKLAGADVTGQQTYNVTFTTASDRPLLTGIGPTTTGDTK